MCDHLSVWRRRSNLGFLAKQFCHVVLAGIALSNMPAKPAAAESSATKVVSRPSSKDQYDPFESGLLRMAAPAGESHADARPVKSVDATAAADRSRRAGLRQVKLQPPQRDAAQGEIAPRDAQQVDLSKNPCAAMDEKPLGELGIGIALPDGKLPDDFASACWDQLDATAGPLAAMRIWPSFVYNWNATCLCHRPLYFEQINLERHGYGCCESLQPLASAAHFFATVPALPYCMAVECPCECVYTLGHYRPGSCPPWRHHWPPFSPLAVAAQGGVWTGMIFLIP